MSESMIVDAYEILRWSRVEPRIAAVTPYVYKSFPPEYGLQDIPHMCPPAPGPFRQQPRSACRKLFDVWQSIGEAIKGRTSAQ